MDSMNFGVPPQPLKMVPLRTTLPPPGEATVVTSDTRRAIRLAADLASIDNGQYSATVQLLLRNVLRDMGS